MMSDNLWNIIHYINNNLSFGSKLMILKVEELFKKYPVSDREKETVFSRLDYMNIEIIYSRESLKEKISKLFKYIGPNKELKETKLNKWFETEKISYGMQKQICDSLNILGYTIINDIHKDFDFLDEFDFEPLDIVLDDASFKNEVLKLKNVVDKSHNLEYLIDFQSREKGFEKREWALDNLINANKELVWEIV